MKAHSSASPIRRIAAVATASAVASSLVLVPAAQAAPQSSLPGIGVLPTSALEGTKANGQLVFPVDLSRPAPQKVTVKWVALLDSANSVDIVDQIGTITIPKGAQRGKIVISAQADETYEKDETFRLKLTSVTGARVVRSTAAGKIINDDAYPIVLGPTSTIRVPEGTGDTPVAPQVRVTLSNPNSSKFTLRWSLAAASQVGKSSVAAADMASDVISCSGTVQVPANSTSIPLSLPVVPDNIDEPDETMTLQLSTVGEQAIQRSVNVVIVDDDETPAAANVTRKVSFTEGSDLSAAQPTVTIPLTKVPSADATFNWAVKAGTANAADVTATSGTVSVPAGSKEMTIPVPIAADGMDEGDETFTMAISAGTGAAIEGDGTLEVQILDDDFSAVANVTRQVSVTEGSDPTAAQQTVTIPLSTVPTMPSKFSWSIRPGTTGANDVTATSGTVSLEAGATELTLPLPVAADTIDEGDETFTMAVTAGDGAAIEGNGLLDVTVLDDDFSALANVTQSVTMVEGSDKTAPAQTVTIPLKTAPTSDAKYTWAVRLGTAVRADVTAVSGSVTVPARSTELVIPVPISADANDEADESFTMAVTAGAGAQLEGDGLIDVTITDDDSPANPVVTGFADQIGSNPTPRLLGSAKTGIVRFYLDATCSGTPVLTAPAGAFANGVPIPVNQNADTQVFANVLSPFAADDQAESVDPNVSSACITSSKAVYTHDNIKPAAAVITSIDPVPYRPIDSSTIFGNAEPGTVVNGFALPNCAGLPYGSVGGEEFALKGLPVTAGTLIGSVPVSTSFSVTDRAGNTVCSNWRTFTFDTVAPVAPTLSSATLVPGVTPAALGLKGSTTDTDIVKVEVMDGTCTTVLDTGVLTDLTSGILLVPGTYTGSVKVRATDGTGNVGPCSTGLTVDAVLPIPPSPLDTPAGPATDSPVLSRNSKVANAMLGDDTVDWYGVNMTAPGSWSFTLSAATGIGCSTAPAVTLQLIDPDGVILASGAGGLGACAQLSTATDPALGNLTPGKYWLRIERDTTQVWPADGYLGTMSFRFAGVENEPNNTAARADVISGGNVCPTNLPIVPGPGIVGGICADSTLGDVDWFTFQAAPKVELRVIVGGCANFDLPAAGYKATQVYELYDSSMRLQARADVNPALSCWPMLIKAAKTGAFFDTRYYVKVVTTGMAGGGNQPYQVAPLYK